MKEQKTLETNSLFYQFLGFLDTPPLWTDTGHFDFPQYHLKKISKEELPADLQDLEIPPTLVLGKRIELLFQYYIERFSEEEVLAANTQIISEKITLGELDFILKNRKSEKITHVEVVYKFYLYDPAFENELDRWIGPNRRDSLVKKNSRLQQQQFPLLYRKETKAYLDKLNIPSEEVEQKALFRANLFIPLHLAHKELPLINNDCIKGYWIKASDFSEAKYGKFWFFSPKKPDWPVDPKHGKEWYSYSEITEQLQILLKKKKSALIWMKKNEEEYERFFVVWW